jgi:hypothetical protein
MITTLDNCLNLLIDQHVLGNNAGKQLSQAATVA